MTVTSVEGTAHEFWLANGDPTEKAFWAERQRIFIVLFID